MIDTGRSLIDFPNQSLYFIDVTPKELFIIILDDEQFLIKNWIIFYKTMERCLFVFRFQRERKVGICLGSFCIFPIEQHITVRVLNFVIGFVVRHETFETSGINVKFYLGIFGGLAFPFFRNCPTQTLLDIHAHTSRILSINQSLI